MKLSIVYPCLLFAFFAYFKSIAIAENNTETIELADLSIEQLINLKITSVSKKSQSLSEAAAAIYVLTNEEIRRSGATSIPEALRIVPGLNVARINSNTWAITSRGFNGLFANKMLVLIDGRSVYTPLFSGVFWDTQDTLLEDIDRIEVIRGPGATLWGSNAVNGVINVITKNSKNTIGNLAIAGGGTEEKYFGAIRHGQQISNDTSFRIYAKHNNRDSLELTDGTSAYDSWDFSQAGFRLDSSPSEQGSTTILGNIYYGEDSVKVVTPSILSPFSHVENEDRFLSGGNILARIDRIFTDESDAQLQIYYDRVSRDDGFFNQSRDTIDLELQHRFSPFNNHDVIWGAGYRFYHDNLDGTFTVDFSPKNRDVDLTTWFIQDEITLIEEKLKLIIGSKFEYTEFTGFEIQPNVRTVLTTSDSTSFWAAISRAVRTPSRTVNDGTLTARVIPGDPGLTRRITIIGNRDYNSEALLAYELGSRVSLTNSLSFDIALFYNDYRSFQTLEPLSPILTSTPPPSHVIVPLQFNTKAQGETYGIEIVSDWRPTDIFRVVASYAFLNINIALDDDSGDTTALSAEGESPKNQATLRTYLDLPYNTTLDSTLRYVDSLPTLNVHSYINMDVRLAWQATKDIEFSVVGQNLIEDESSEFVSSRFIMLPETQVQRGAYGQVKVSF